MSWIKKGLIYNVAHYSDWAHSHVHKPSVLLPDFGASGFGYAVFEK